MATTLLTPPADRDDLLQLSFDLSCPALNRTAGDFYEFFAGGGMARAGLGDSWRCLFANDFDHKKARSYERHWGGGDTLRVGDVGALTSRDLPGQPDLVWASFPCQDLSLAGAGAGLRGDRSGTFWPFWRLMQSVIREDRGPAIVALENVCGALTSHNGSDFAAICSAVRDAGYSMGAVVIDASLFVPQSRPRLFIIAVRSDIRIPTEIRAAGPVAPWHSRTLRSAYNRLDNEIKQAWIWWKLPKPESRPNSLSEIIEESPPEVLWHSTAETKRLLDMMTEVNRAKVAQATQAGRIVIGGVYKRTRCDDSGTKVQRAEVRFDNVAGCLRTPAGGSSRQILLVIDGGHIRSRLISTRETARLMGLPEEYVLPERYNEAYHLTGDGVVVPVVRHLASNLFEPIIHANKLIREVE